MKNRNRIMISIIVPVYNTEEYVGECLDSVIKQLDDTIELIIIDDGSTDGSSIICCNKVKNKSNVQYIKQDNKGASAARNHGLRISRGEYVIFVDSDDVLSENAIKKISALITNREPDIISFGYYKMHKKRNKSIRSTNSMIVGKNEAIRKMVLDPSFGGYIANKAFNMEIIRRNNLSFDEDKKISEDLQFVYDFLQKSKKIYIEKECLYYYRMRASSALNSKNASLHSPISVYDNILKEHPELSRDIFPTYTYLAYKYRDYESLNKYKKRYCVKGKTINNALSRVYLTILPITARNHIRKAKWRLGGYYK